MGCCELGKFRDDDEDVEEPGVVAIVEKESSSLMALSASVEFLNTASEAVLSHIKSYNTQLTSRKAGA